MSACTEWRPLAMKGICQCGARWSKHSEAVKEAATVKWLEQRGCATDSAYAKRADDSRAKRKTDISKPEQLDALVAELRKK